MPARFLTKNQLAPLYQISQRESILVFSNVKVFTDKDEALAWIKSE
jgi:hypothetical protein